MPWKSARGTACRAQPEEGQWRHEACRGCRGSLPSAQHAQHSTQVRAGSGQWAQQQQQQQRQPPPQPAAVRRMVHSAGSRKKERRGSSRQALRPPLTMMQPCAAALGRVAHPPVDLQRRRGGGEGGGLGAAMQQCVCGRWWRWGGVGSMLWWHPVGCSHDRVLPAASPLGMRPPCSDQPIAGHCDWQQCCTSILGKACTHTWR